MARTAGGEAGRGNSASPSNSDNIGADIEPALEVGGGGGSSIGKNTGGLEIRTINYPDGGIYEGEVRDGHHGNGVYRFANGGIYDGEWKHGTMQGRGVFRFNNGLVYDGKWENGYYHGRGTLASADFEYKGQFVEGKFHGKGALRQPSGTGTVYEGEFVDGERHGWGAQTFRSGDVYEGQWKGGEPHGRGTMKLPTGDIIDEGIWTDGKFTPDADIRKNDTAPKAGRECEGRKLRSIRSQQRRLEVAKKNCEHCGVDDGQYKLRVCSGCNLALYCSASCQKAARRSHQRICDIISVLPSRDADRLVLRYDKDKTVDLDAGLRYATKYMGELKHLQINLEAKGTDDAVTLSAKQLSSLLRSKKESLESVFWLCNDCIPEGSNHGPNGNEVWTDLGGLKQLRLEYLTFGDIQPVSDLLYQQKETLEVLCLPFLQIDWHKAKTRRAVAEVVKSCKHLVKLDLQGCVLMDSDLKAMLHGLPNLRVLNLARDPIDSHEFTDNTCGLIARKCPGLQELSLNNHDQLSVRGVRKIFEGCVHLRSFYTTTRKLTCADVRALLDIAPQLLLLAFHENDISAGDLDKIIEATGGRTVLKLSNRGGRYAYDSDSISAKTRENYECQKSLLVDIGRRWKDPEVANEWAGVLKG